MQAINWYGTYSLSKREISRFIKVYHQTLITPVTSSLIFLAIFTLAAGSSRKEIAGILFIEFIGYGLIIMSIIQNAFANSSSSFVMSKVLGYIVDILIPPLGAIEIIFAFCLGSIIRALCVGILTALALSPFIDFHVHHPFYLIFFSVAGSLLLAQAGIISGLFAETFDQSAAFNSYIMTPLSFLSGTFYTVQSLPVIFQKFNLFNPIFYIIDGFRYSLTDHVDGNIEHGVLILVIGNILLFMLNYRLIDIGWRIKN